VYFDTANSADLTAITRLKSSVGLFYIALYVFARKGYLVIIQTNLVIHLKIFQYRYQQYCSFNILLSDVLNLPQIPLQTLALLTSYRVELTGALSSRCEREYGCLSDEALNFDDF
jgi:hypothetical protein